MNEPTEQTERVREFGKMLTLVESILRDAADVDAEIDYAVAAWIEHFGINGAEHFRARLNAMAARIAAEQPRH